MFLTKGNHCILAASLLLFSLAGHVSLAEGAQLSIAWDKNPEPDIRGYHVYRAQASSQFQRVTSQPIPETRFTDLSVSAGQSYRYAVTAVSSSGLESGFSNQVESYIPLPGSVVSANAGPNQVAREGSTVTVSGQGGDSQGGAVTFQWTQLSGPTLELTGGGLDRSSLSFRVVGVSGDAVVKLRLTVSNAQGTKAEDELQVTIENNHPPVLSTSTAISVQSGAPSSLRASVSDPEGDNVSVTWKQTSGPKVDLRPNSTGGVNFTAPAVQTDSVLLLEVTAEDGIESQSVPVRVTVFRARQTLRFPATIQEAQTSRRHFIGFSVYNPSLSTDPVVVRVLDDAGEELGSSTLELQPNGQSAFLLNEIPSSNQLLSSEVSIFGVDSEIQGFFMAGTWAQDALDGIGGDHDSASELYLPLEPVEHIRDVSLFASSRIGPDDTVVKVELLRQDGTYVADRSFSMPSGTSKTLSLLDLFNRTLPAGGYLKLSSATEFSALAFNLTDSSISTVPARAKPLLRRATIPHFLVESNSTTVVSLLNTGSETARPKMKFYDSSGSVLIEKSLAISRKARQLVDLKDVLPPTGTLVTGHVEIDFTADSAVLVGVGYSINGGEAMTSLPAPQERGTTLFLHTAQSKRYRMFTGLAIVNPSSSSSQVTIEARDQTGILTAERTIHLSGHGRFVSMLNADQLFGRGFEQVGGHLRIEASSPVAAIALFGDMDSRFIAAIEGQGPGKQ